MAHALLRNGFDRINGFFSESDLKDIIIHLPSLNRAAGTRNLLDLNWYQALAQDERLLSIVRALLGSRARAHRGILFDKSEDANWTLGLHQDTKIAVKQRIDTAGFSGWSVKEGVVHCQPPVEYLEESLAIRIHLDPSTPTNGPLMILPGSHLDGIGSMEPDGVPKMCLAEPGDLILMKPLVWHGSGKSTEPGMHRRVIHLEYCGLELPGRLEWAYG